MKKARKALLTLCAALLLVTMTAGVTIAYLTDDDAVVNTFTIGKVDITLDEANVDGKDAEGEDNKSETRDQANSYQLIPGRQFDKDPIIHFQPDSEASFLYVKVINELAAIEVASSAEGNSIGTIDGQIKGDGWTVLQGPTEVTETVKVGEEDIATKTTTTIYWKKVEANTSEDAVDYDLFTNFKVAEDATNNQITAHNGKTIKVTAYAIQAEGFAATETKDVQQVAWEAGAWND